MSYVNMYLYTTLPTIWYCTLPYPPRMWLACDGPPAGGAPPPAAPPLAAAAPGHKQPQAQAGAEVAVPDTVFNINICSWVRVCVRGGGGGGYSYSCYSYYAVACVVDVHSLVL